MGNAASVGHGEDVSADANFSDALAEANAAEDEASPLWDQCAMAFTSIVGDGVLHGVQLVESVVEGSAPWNEEGARKRGRQTVACEVRDGGCVVTARAGPGVFVSFFEGDKRALGERRTGEPVVAWHKDVGTEFRNTEALRRASLAVSDLDVPLFACFDYIGRRCAVVCESESQADSALAAAHSSFVERFATAATAEAFACSSSSSSSKTRSRAAPGTSAKHPERASDNDSLCYVMDDVLRLPMPEAPGLETHRRAVVSPTRRLGATVVRGAMHLTPREPLQLGVSLSVGMCVCVIVSLSLSLSLSVCMYVCVYIYDIYTYIHIYT